MNKQFWYSFAAAQMQVAGDLLKMQDADNTGSDDMAGSLIKSGSTALMAFVRGDVKGFRKVLRLIADSINTFLDETPEEQ